MIGPVEQRSDAAIAMDYIPGPSAQHRDWGMFWASIPGAAQEDGEP
jgi:hypothetical protein